VPGRRRTAVSAAADHAGQVDCRRRVDRVRSHQRHSSGRNRDLIPAWAVARDPRQAIQLQRHLFGPAIVVGMDVHIDMVSLGDKAMVPLRFRQGLLKHKTVRSDHSNVP